jgi:hypothetical protein
MKATMMSQASAQTACTGLITAAHLHIYLLSAFDRLPEPSRALGMTARLITGSGTFMLTIVYLHDDAHLS